MADNNTAPDFSDVEMLVVSVGGAPLVPVACAANRAWYLNTWDRFMIPKPFARIAIAIGEPIDVPRNSSMDEIEAIRTRMQSAMDSLIQASKAAVVEAT